MRKTPSVGGCVRVLAWSMALMICASLPAMAACNLNGAWEGSYSDNTGDYGTLTVTFFNSTSTTFNMNVAYFSQNQGQLYGETPSGSINGSTLSWTYTAVGEGTQTGSATVASDCNHISGTVVSVFINDPVSSTGTFTLSRTPVNLSVGSVTFQQTAIGGGSTAQGLTVSNGGTSTLSLGAPGVDGDFSVVAPGSVAGLLSPNDRAHAATNCGTSLAPGASCSIGVTCNPTGPGIRSGNLYVNDPNKTPLGSVSLTCSGVQPLAGASFLPVSGWWWDSKLNGTGFFIEYGGKSGLGMFVGGFLYDASGNSTWLVSTGPISGTTYTSSWLKVSGGQTLTGTYKAPSQTGAGNISVKFVDANDAVMTRPDGSQINLVRFSFSATQTPTPPVGGAPQSGWWWAGSAFSGTGYGIEIQGSAVFIVAYVYDGTGNPIWYLATGSLTSPTSYAGTWNIYAGGPQLTSPEGSYAAHPVNGSAVNMTLSFQDSTHGTLTMGSVSIPIVRFQEF